MAPSSQLEENNFQGGVHIVPKDKVKEVAEKMLGKTPLGVKVVGFFCMFLYSFGNLDRLDMMANHLLNLLANKNHGWFVLC